MIRKTESQIQEMRDKIAYDERARLDRELSGMTYAEGMANALEWVLGQSSDEELLNLE